MSHSFDRTSPIERVLRKAFRLHPGKPSLAPMVTDANGRLEFASKEQRYAEKAMWHDEGWKAEFAERVGDTLSWNYIKRSAGGWKDDIKAKIRNRKVAKGLRETDTIVFGSYYCYSKKESWSVEGYLEFDNGERMPLSVIAADGFAEFVEAHAKQNRELRDKGIDFNIFYNSDDSILLMNNWIFVPGERVTPEICETAILEWYKRRFEYVRGHKSNFGFEPEISFQIEIDADEIEVGA